MNSTFSDYLDKRSLKPLTPAELRKPNHSTGEIRIDILKRLIESNEELELIDGTTFKCTNIEGAVQKLEQFDENSKAFELEGLINEKVVNIKSSRLAKSKVFGGLKGAGAGVQITALTESIQCVYLALAIDILGRDLKCEDITVENVKDAWKRVRVDVPLKTVLSKQPDDWINSSILIANKLRKSGVLQKNMMYHRNSEVMKSIYKTAREVFKNEGVPFKKINGTQLIFLRMPCLGSLILIRNSLMV